MFKVVEMPTAEVLLETPSFETAAAYIENIESSPVYEELLSKYGSTRRIQQEMTITAT